MSFLEDNELEALYDHIGVIRHKEAAKSDPDKPSDRPSAASAAVSAMPGRTEAKKEQHKDHKSMPRIIRTTEVIINTRDEYYDPKPVKSGQTGNNQQKKPDIIRVADANTGLRAGFVRDAGPGSRNAARPVSRFEAIKPQLQKIEVQPQEELVKNVKAEPVKSQENVKFAEAVPVNDTKSVNVDLPAIPVVNITEIFETPMVKKEAEEPKNASVQLEPQITLDIQPSIPVIPVAETNSAEIILKSDDTSVQRLEQKPAQGHEERSVERKFEQKLPDRKPLQGQDLQQGRPEQRPFQRFGQRVEQRTDQRPTGQGYDQRPGQGYNQRPAGQGYDQRPSQGYSQRPAGQGYDQRPGQGYNQRPAGQGYDQRPGQGYSQRPAGQGYSQRPETRPGERLGERPADRTGQRFGQRTGDQRFGDRPDQRTDQRPDVRGPFAGGQGRPQGDIRRPGYDRPVTRPGGPVGSRMQGDNRPPRPFDRPKPEFGAIGLGGVELERTMGRREFKPKEFEPEAIKKDIKKETAKVASPVKPKKFNPQNLIGEKKHLNEVLSDEFVLDERFEDNTVKAKKLQRGKKDSRVQRVVKHIPARAVLTNISLPEAVTVKELAEALKKTSSDVIKKLMNLGIMATINHEVDFDTAAIIADEFGIKADKLKVVTEEDILFDDSEDTLDKLVPRPPVVVVMGHVDHGKTSLLDAIRETNVIDSEAGGITQHIGAYMVDINNRNITFLDTPGHEAFTAMRARGAQVTDIAILVVAADDGVMPQTIEAINHAKAAKVAIIVALNKIDKPEADPEKVKRQLTEYGLVPEEWGGDVIFVPVSAKKHENIDHLLEMVLLTADVLELKTNPFRQAKGTVIEAKLDKSRGPVATVLIQRGTLNTGDSLVTGSTVGRIRAMLDDKGRPIKSAGPSTPVEIVGLSEVPEAGETFYAITDEKVAKQLAEKRKTKQREETLKSVPRVSLDALFEQIKEGKVKDLHIIVKADVQGSVEAIKQSLEKLSNEEVRVRIIHGAVGAITESDVRLAEVSNAIIIGFNVRPALNVQDIAESVKVDIRLYRIIYDAIQNIEAAMKGMLEPTFKEVVQGHTEIRQIFRISGIGSIGGCYVLDGKITKSSDVRLVRNGIVVFEGKLSSLKRFKDDAREVLQGFECGLSLEKFNDIKEGDIVESYVMQEETR